MYDWVCCPGCRLNHTSRPDGRCPRCGVATGAPDLGEGEGEPLPTELAPPAGASVVPAPASLAPPAPARPRVWTVFVVFAVAQLAALAGGVIVAVVTFATSGVHGGQALHALAKSPGLMLAFVGVGALFSAVTALAAGACSRERLLPRLNLGAPDLGAGRIALATLGALGVSAVFSGICAALHYSPSGTLAELSRILSAATDPRRGGLFVVAVAVIGLVGPVAEELLFRGYAQTRLVRRFGPGAGILITSALFGLAHFDKVQSLFALAFGLYLGWLTLRARSIVPAMVAHAVNNTVAVLGVRLADGAHDAATATAAGATRAVIGLAIVVATVWLLRPRPAAPPAAMVEAAPPT